MINSTYTLQRVAENLHQLLEGKHLVTCFTQVKDALVLGFASPDEEVWVEIDASGQRSSVFTHSEYHRARSNSADVFERLIDATITSVVNPENERVIELNFSNNMQLVCVLFGRSSDNVYLVRNGKAADALSQETDLPRYGPRASQPLDISSDQTIKQHLQQTRNLLGGELIAQVCEYIQIEPSTVVNTLSPQQFLQLVSAVAELKATIRNAEHPWCVEGEHQFELHVAWQRECSHGAQEFNAGIAKVVMRNRGVATIKEELDTLRRSVNRKVQKLRKQSLGINEQEARKRIENYRLYGHVLLGQPNGSLRGLSELESQDYEGNRILIPLSSKLTLHENAQKYFDKAKKSETEITVRQKRQKLAEKELAAYTPAEEALVHIHGYKALQRFYKQFPEFKPIMKDQANSTAQYREFDLGEGYVLYVGKDAASNDRLTLKFAKPHDIWLHARGCSGSHCILRGGDKDKKPPRHILEAAAEIAAYYSKARNGKHVPVAWTRKKYVRKPKGANVGAVVIDRETVVQVDPKLP